MSISLNRVCLAATIYKLYVYVLYVHDPKVNHNDDMQHCAQNGHSRDSHRDCLRNPASFYHRDPPPLELPSFDPASQLSITRSRTTNAFQFGKDGGCGTISLSRALFFRYQNEDNVI